MCRSESWHRRLRGNAHSRRITKELLSQTRKHMFREWTGACRRLGRIGLPHCRIRPPDAHASSPPLDATHPGDETHERDPRDVGQELCQEGPSVRGHLGGEAFAARDVQPRDAAPGFGTRGASWGPIVPACGRMRRACGDMLPVWLFILRRCKLTEPVLCHRRLSGLGSCAEAHTGGLSLALAPTPFVCKQIQPVHDGSSMHTGP